MVPSSSEDLRRGRDDWKYGQLAIPTTEIERAHEAWKADQLSARAAATGAALQNDPGQETFCKILTNIPRGDPTYGEIAINGAGECPKAFWTTGTRSEDDYLAAGDKVWRT